MSSTPVLIKYSDLHVRDKVALSAIMQQNIHFEAKTYAEQ